jgi:protein involved in polysaccharide export with SLBB domain
MRPDPRNPVDRLRKRPTRAAFALVASLAACTGRVAVAPLQPSEVAQLQASANDPAGNYRVEPGDTLAIHFPFQVEMDQQAVVRPDGQITANLVGDILVGGLTTTEVEGLLRSGTSARLRDPQVEVTIARFSPKYVYVTGEVDKPGMVVYRDGLTPLQAVIESGGFRDTALTSSVILVRAADSPELFISRSLDLDESIRAGVPEPLQLAPHDVLYVPRTSIAEANVWVDQHVTKLLPFMRGTTTSFPFGF